MTEPMLDSSPTSDDVRKLIHRTNWTVAVGMLVIAVICGIAVVFAARGAAASRDSFNATAVQLATQERSACITERRNTQLKAQGQETAALGRALIAAFIADNTDEALAQVALFEKAAKAQDAASASVEPKVLNAPRSDGGCGPPILTIDDLKETPR